jgi:hypothetical protein
LGRIITLPEDRPSFFPSARLLAELKALEALPPDWDVGGAQPPNQLATDNAWMAVGVLEEMGFEPTRIEPSAESGVGIVFRSGLKYAHLEFFNSGLVMAALMDEDQNAKAWEVDPEERGIKEALGLIHGFLTR